MQMPCELHNSIACYMQLHKVKRLKGSALPSHDLHFAFSNYKYTWGFFHFSGSLLSPPHWHQAKDHKDCHLSRTFASSPRRQMQRGWENRGRGLCIVNACQTQVQNKTQTKPKQSPNTQPDHKR